MMHRVRVLIVDDSADIRDIYRRLLDKQADLVCVGTMHSTVGLEEAIGRERAEVAVVDLVAPGRDAFEAIRSAAAAAPSCRIIAFSGHDDAATRGLAADAGAWAFVSKTEHPFAILEVIRRASAPGDLSTGAGADLGRDGPRPEA